jgi:uncharacterized membrane protein
MNRLAPKYFAELDLMRGLAVTMMVANHFGFGLLSKEAVTSSLANACIQFGGFAPVLFFLTTGIVMGIQRGHAISFSRTLFRIIILFAADGILTLATRGFIGFDFLAFIGLSTLVGYVLVRSRQGMMLSVIGFCLFAGLRFGVGSFLSSHVSDQTLRQLSFVIGVKSIDGVAYPLSPWLCFPFLGFFLSEAIVVATEETRSRRLNTLLFAIGAAFIAASSYCVSQGAVFFRYSTVSAAYFGAAMGVALVSIAACRVAAYSSQLLGHAARFFSTRGVACLSIVPIHYLLLAILRSMGLGDLSPSEYLLVLAVAIPACLVSGRMFETYARIIVSNVSARAILWLSAAVLFLSLFLCCIAGSTLLRTCGLFLGQSALCVVLAGIDRWHLVKKAGGSNSKFS